MSSPSHRRRQRATTTRKAVHHRLFPNAPNVDKRLLQADTKEALYSITKPDKARRIQQLLQHHLRTNFHTHPKQCTVLDGTACVGGDTLHFAKHFRKVVAIEKNPEHHAMLCNNVKTYGYTNVECVHADVVRYLATHMRTLRPDVCFFDPPWGGTAYHEAAHAPLTFTHDDGTSTTLSTLVHTQLAKYPPKLVALKTPLNYDAREMLNTRSTRGWSTAKRTATQAPSVWASVHVYHLGNMALWVWVRR